MGTPTHPTNSRYERVRPLTQAIWPHVVADVRGVRHANRARPRAPGNCCCRSDALRGAARSLVEARAQHVLLALRIRARAWRGACVTVVTAVACVRSLACPASRAFVRSLRAE